MCEKRILNSQFKSGLKRFTATLSSNCVKHNETLRFFIELFPRGAFVIPLSTFNSSVDLKLKQCVLLMICSDSNCMKVND